MSSLTVLALVAASEVTGPLRGLFQLVEHAKDLDVRYVLGMFLVKGIRTTPAIEEAQRRGFDVRILHQRGRYDVRLLWQTGRLIQRDRIAIVQSHGYKSALIGWLCRRSLGIPWVAFSHGYTSEDRRITLYNGLDRWLVRRADRVIAVSRAMATALDAAGVPAARLHVIHNAIDADAMEIPRRGPGLQARHVRLEWGLERHHLVIGVIGRLSPEKGQRVFVQAFRRLADDQATRAVLIGDGPDRDTLARDIAAAGLEGRVRLVGHRRDMRALYAELDLVVIPSLSEGLPNVLLEAMLAGKAVVATRVGGIPEVLEPAKVGWLVPPGDPGALAAAMKEALDNRAKREADAGESARYVRQHFTAAARVARVVAVYRDLVERQ